MSTPSPRPPPPPPPPPSTRSRGRREPSSSEETLTGGESLQDAASTIGRRSNENTSNITGPRGNHNMEPHENMIQNPIPVQQNNLQLQHKEQNSAMLTVRTTYGDYLQILITPEMEPEELGLCITHATLSPEDESKLMSRWRSNDESIGNMVEGFQLAGLFRERDDVYVPLQVILQDLNVVEQDTFRISRRPHHEPTKHSTKKPSSLSPSVIREMIIYATFALYAAIRIATGEGIGPWFERGILHLINIPFRIMETFVDFPLRELYRYGPSIVGWEGISLPHICSQVTHMGDEQFWKRNIDECQKIYETKELASLHFRRPIVFFFLAYLIFLAIRSLVRTAAIRNQNRPTHDMIETYKAFQMILRVFHRGMNRLEDDRHMKGRRFHS